LHTAIVLIRGRIWWLLTNCSSQGTYESYAQRIGNPYLLTKAFD
jgi:hypothetical protein